MKFFAFELGRRFRLGTFFKTGVVLLAAITLCAHAQAADQPKAAGQKSFTTPDEAVKALQTAAETKDKMALMEIFGPEYKDLLTGDKVEDEHHAEKFAEAMAAGCNQMKDGDSKIILEIGTNNWPMPIPLVKENGKWYFDTAAGKEEIINRHVGRDELHAIGVCRAYVAAQKTYAQVNPKVTGGIQYALKFKSTPGQKDGLYWDPSDKGPESPFGPVIAEAHAEGYLKTKGTGPQSFHGYYFKIITRQGKAAPGGRLDYMNDGILERGFALVAYPEHWDQSGVMTFIVNQEGKVYQRNLGEKTLRLAKALNEYNPDSNWMLVDDQGEIGAVTEKVPEK